MSAENRADNQAALFGDETCVGIPFKEFPDSWFRIISAAQTNAGSFSPESIDHIIIIESHAADNHFPLAFANLN